MLIVAVETNCNVMRTRIILTCVMAVLCGNAFAQDIIHTLDNPPIEAKVLEISDSHIVYKTFDNLDGPDYIIPVDRVARIVFENGTERIFAPSTIFSTGPYAYDYYEPYGPIDYRWGHFYDRRGRLYAEDMRNYLGVSIYGSEYLKAHSQYQWGTWLTLGGAAVLISSVIGGAMLSDFNSSMDGHGMDGFDTSGESAMYIIGGIAGAACVGAGIPLWIKGNNRLNAIADDYNRTYGRGGYGYSPSLNIGSTGSGIGLAYRF